MVLSRFYHESLLQYVSEQMIRYPHSQKFMHWVCRYLLERLNAGHVSIALYDVRTKTISVEFSEGMHKIPPKLIRLDPGSSLIQWFQGPPHSAHSFRHFHRLLTQRYLSHSSDPNATYMLEELMRHHTEVCVKIETHNQLAGYLLIGPRADGRTYTSSDIIFFQILANDIAIEIEKEEYYFSSHYDCLTGLLNRSTLDSALDGLMIKARETKTELAAALFDLDDFKVVNDSYGHLTGDHVLRITAAILRENIRKTDLAFRYGGEEFLLLLPMISRNPLKEISPEEFRAGIIAVVERLRGLVARPIHCPEHEVTVSFSIGLAFYLNDENVTGEDLIRSADEALYRSKQNGKNQLTVHNANLVKNPSRKQP